MPWEDVWNEVTFILDPAKDPGNVIRIWIMFMYLKQNRWMRDDKLVINHRIAQSITAKAVAMQQPGCEDGNDLKIVNELKEFLKEKPIERFYKSYERNKRPRV